MRSKKAGTSSRGKGPAKSKKPSSNKVVAKKSAKAAPKKAAAKKKNAKVAPVVAKKKKTGVTQRVVAGKKKSATSKIVAPKKTVKPSAKKKPVAVNKAPASATAKKSNAVKASSIAAAGKKKATTSSVAAPKRSAKPPAKKKPPVAALSKKPAPKKKPVAVKKQSIKAAPRPSPAAARKKIAKAAPAVEKERKPTASRRVPVAEKKTSTAPKTIAKPPARKRTVADAIPETAIPADSIASNRDDETLVNDAPKRAVSIALAASTHDDNNDFNDDNNNDFNDDNDNDNDGDDVDVGRERQDKKEEELAGEKKDDGEGDEEDNDDNNNYFNSDDYYTFENGDDVDEEARMMIHHDEHDEYRKYGNNNANNQPAGAVAVPVPALTPVEAYIKRLVEIDFFGNLFVALLGFYTMSRRENSSLLLTSAKFQLQGIKGNPGHVVSAASKDEFKKLIFDRIKRGGFCSIQFLGFGAGDDEPFKERPLMIDMDLDDLWDDQKIVRVGDFKVYTGRIRQCCKGQKRVCSKCWKILVCGCKIITHVLRSLDLPAEVVLGRDRSIELFYSFSGGRGAHIYVMDSIFGSLRFESDDAVIFLHQKVSLTFYDVDHLGGHHHGLDYYEQIFNLLVTTFRDVFCAWNDETAVTTAENELPDRLVNSIFYSENLGLVVYVKVLEALKIIGAETILDFEEVYAKFQSTLFNFTTNRLNRQFFDEMFFPPEGAVCYRRLIRDYLAYHFVRPPVDAHVSGCVNSSIRLPCVVHPSTGNVATGFCSVEEMEEFPVGDVRPLSADNLESHVIAANRWVSTAASTARDLWVLRY